MKPTIQLLCLSRSMSPITHQSGTVGNESVLNDEPVRTPLGVRRVPMLSGNAIRHRLLRGPAASILVERWGLAGNLTKDELNLLFHGGLRREASARVSLARTADMERLFPMLRLLGACFTDDIYPGSVNVLRGMLCCRENEPRIRVMTPAGWCDENLSLAPATSFVQRWQYVRSEANKTQAHLKPSDAKELDADPKGGGSDMMPFAGTAVLAGAEWLHGFIMRHADDLMLGCLFSAIERWQNDGATIGGMQSRGHGILSLSVAVPPEINVAECVAKYNEHLEAAQIEGVAMLKSFYVAKQPRKSKQKTLVPDDGGDDE